MMENKKKKIFCGAAVLVIVVAWILYRKIKKRRKLKKAQASQGEH